MNRQNYHQKFQEDISGLNYDWVEFLFYDSRDDQEKAREWVSNLDIDQDMMEEFADQDEHDYEFKGNGHDARERVFGNYLTALAHELPEDVVYFPDVSRTRRFGAQNEKRLLVDGSSGSRVGYNQQGGEIYLNGDIGAGPGKGGDDDGGFIFAKGLDKYSPYHQSDTVVVWGAEPSDFTQSVVKGDGGDLVVLNGEAPEDIQKYEDINVLSRQGESLVSDPLGELNNSSPEVEDELIQAVDCYLSGLGAPEKYQQEFDTAGELVAESLDQISERAEFDSEIKYIELEPVAERVLDDISTSSVSEQDLDVLKETAEEFLNYKKLEQATSEIAKQVRQKDLATETGEQNPFSREINRAEAEEITSQVESAEIHEEGVEIWPSQTVNDDEMDEVLDFYNDNSILSEPVLSITEDSVNLSFTAYWAQDEPEELSEDYRTEVSLDWLPKDMDTPHKVVNILEKSEEPQRQLEGNLAKEELEKVFYPEGGVNWTYRSLGGWENLSSMPGDMTEELLGEIDDIGDLRSDPYIVVDENTIRASLELDLQDESGEGKPDIEYVFEWEQNQRLDQIPDKLA